MYAVATVEKHPIRDVGYPYLISFNNSEDFQEATNGFLQAYNFKALDNRTIDCINEENCINIAKKIISYDMTNLDLGAYQICYYWHKLPIENFFDLQQNYLDACSIIENVAKTYGPSWESIARYHVFPNNEERKKRNALYAQKLEKIIIKNYPELAN
jgi:hypothetical protein